MVRTKEEEKGWLSKIQLLIRLSGIKVIFVLKNIQYCLSLPALRLCNPPHPPKLFLSIEALKGNQSGVWGAELNSINK